MSTRCNRFAKIGDQAVGEAAVFARISDHGVDALDFELLVLLEQLHQLSAERLAVGLGLQQLEALAIAGHLEGDPVVVLQVIERAQDDGARMAGTRGGRVHIECDPLACFFSTGQDFAQEGGLRLWIVGQNLGSGLMRFKADVAVVIAVEADDAEELKMGEQGTDDKLADIVCLGEFAGGYIDLVAGVEQAVDEAGDVDDIGRVAIDKVLQRGAVGRTSKEFADRGCAIATGPAGFLHVAFIAFGQVVVVDIADIGFVDAHTKCDGCANDWDITRHELFLRCGALLGFKPRMVGGGIESVLAKQTRGVLGIFLKVNIDDRWAGWALMEAFKQQLIALAALAGGDAEFEVGAVKAGVDNVGGLNLKGGSHIVGDFRRGGGREGQYAFDVERFNGIGQLEVVGPKVVAPCRDAVGFVDGEQADLLVANEIEKAFIGEPFGGDKQHFELAVADGVGDLAIFVFREAGVESFRQNVFGLQAIDLVFHQGQQRGDDQRQAGK